MLPYGLSITSGLAINFNPQTEGTETMEIIKVSRYQVAGEEFETHAKAVSHIQDMIGHWIDEQCLNLSPRDKIALHDALCRDRGRLRDLLSTEMYDLSD